MLQLNSGDLKKDGYLCMQEQLPKMDSLFHIHSMY